MSNNQDNLENKLSDAKAVAGGMLSKDKHISANGTSAVEVAKTGSIKDLILSNQKSRNLDPFSSVHRKIQTMVILSYVL